MKKNKIYLINKYLDKSLTPEENAVFEELRSSGEITENELEDFKQIIESTSQINPPEFELKKQRITTNTVSVEKTRITTGGFKAIIRVAAILVIGITLGVVIMYSLFNEHEKFVRVETKKGDKIHITMPGNNEAWLNSRSSIEYAESFTGSNRVVNLDGEAYFRFSDNDNSPVLVKCSQTLIICSQASLNIENDTLMNKVEIEVEDGWVAVSHPRLGDRQYIVESGFKGVIDDLIPMWIEQNKDPNYLAWHTGKMIFKNTPLNEVAQTLSEVYDIDIDVRGDLKYCFFTSKFTNEDLNGILKTIENALQTHIRQENNTIVITGNPCLHNAGINN